MKAKKAVAGILAVCTMLGSLSLQGISTLTGMADDGVMRDDMTAQDYADDMGLGINLGNTMEGYWLDSSRVDSGASTQPGNKPQDYETCWMGDNKVVTTQEVINGMKDAGFNTIRIPVYWGNMMKEDGTFTINPDFIGRVKEIVDYCRNAGVYAVINIHHYDEFVIRRFTANDDLEGCSKVFDHLWTQIAEYFKDYSDYLIFEGFNEYLGGGPLDANGKVVDLSKEKAYLWTNTLNQTFVDAVRATGGNNEKRILIASGYFTNIDNTTKPDFKMPTDTVEDRLMVSVHYVDNGSYWSGQIGSKNWIEYSKSQLELLKNAFTEKNIPVFIGETTSIYDYDRFDKRNPIVQSTYEALDYMLRLIKSYGFVPVLWDVNDNFYSRTQYRVKLIYNKNVIDKLSKELKDGTFTAPETPTAPSTTSSSESSQTTPEPEPTTSAPTVAVPQTNVPTQAKLSHLKVRSKKKGKINVVWGKVSGAKGYEVQVSKLKNFKKLILKKTTSKLKLVIKNSKIKSKKVYCVRVRAYRNYIDANGVTKRVNSKWNYVLRKVKVK